MKLVLVWVGKTTTSYFAEATNEYIARLKFYLPLEVITIPDLKNTKALSEAQQRDMEGELILKTIEANDEVILLDDKGREYSSLEFAQWIEKKQHTSLKRLVFVIGGAYGFSQSIYDRANGLLSLSKMTFSHQIIRPIFAEQLYRAMTILKGEPYHHDGSLLSKKQSFK